MGKKKTEEMRESSEEEEDDGDPSEVLNYQRKYSAAYFRSRRCRPWSCEFHRVVWKCMILLLSSVDFTIEIIVEDSFF